MMRPYFADSGDSAQKEFNTIISSLRVAVEVNYKGLKHMWTRQDYARQFKVPSVPIAFIYQTSTLLQNFLVCLYKSGQTIQRFGIDPPSLKEYFNGSWILVFGVVYSLLKI